jgi:hypothetical protein
MLELILEVVVLFPNYLFSSVNSAILSTMHLRLFFFVVLTVCFARMCEKYFTPLFPWAYEYVGTPTYRKNPGTTCHCFLLVFKLGGKIAESHNRTVY